MNLPAGNDQISALDARLREAEEQIARLQLENKRLARQQKLEQVKVVLNLMIFINWLPFFPYTCTHTRILKLSYSLCEIRN